MSKSLVSRTISSVVDQRVSMIGAEMRRLPSMGTDWTKIRLGVRYSLNGNQAANDTGTLYFGLSTGASDGWGVNTVHAAGLKAAATLNFVASTPHYFTAASAAAFVASKTVDGVETVGSALMSSAPMFVNEYSTNRAAFFLEITKGSPNFTFQFAAPTTAAAVQTDITIGKFQEQMDALAWATTDISSWLSGYAKGSAITLAVDQAADGDLVAPVLYFDFTSAIEVCDFTVSRLT